MPGVSIRDRLSADELRYYLYKEITEPGTYEIRGHVATDTFTWTPTTSLDIYTISMTHQDRRTGRNHIRGQ